MPYSESPILSNDGLKLLCRKWTPHTKPGALVCLIHGLGEHGGRYQTMAGYFRQSGYALVTCDLRGHGQSEGQRGHTPSYQALLKDVDLLIQHSREEFPGIPLYLYGHSMGGNLALNYALRYAADLKGVIATSPWLRLAFEPSKTKLILAGFMDHLWPSFSQRSGLGTSALSRNPEIVRAYENDPLVHSILSVRLFKSIYAAGLWALEHAREFPYPLLLMHGTADRLTSCEASKQFAAQVPKGCTFRAWDGFYHELHNEPEQLEVIGYILTWLKSQA